MCTAAMLFRKGFLFHSGCSRQLVLGNVLASANSQKRDRGCSTYTNAWIQNDPYSLNPIILDDISRYCLFSHLK